MAENLEQDVMNPMSELEETSITVRDEAIAGKFEFDLNLRGKWMLFYDIKYMNEMWQRALSLYRAEELDGIVYLKTSTGVMTQRPDRANLGCIRFTCGPCDDEELILRYGLNLVKKMEYFSSFAFVAYKTREQTINKNVAAGAGKNYLLRLPVSTHDHLKMRSRKLDDYPIEVPSQVHDTHLLNESLHSIVVEQIVEPVELGKIFRWSLKFEKGTPHDSAWSSACRLYRTGEMDGILYLSSSTAGTQPGRSNHNLGHIYFYCHPNEPLSRLEEIGENLVSCMKYSDKSGYLKCMRKNVDGPGYSTVCQVQC